MKYTILSTDGAILGEVEPQQSADGVEREVFSLWSSKEDQFQFATALGSFTFVVQRGSVAESGAGARGAKTSVKTQIPGKILRVLCQPGQTVEQNQPLLIIEAMKMENEILSPRAGQIDTVAVTEGQKVETGELLLKFKKES